MMVERWIKAKKILADAFELPSVEREAFVQRSCAGSPELLSMVASLVQETDIPDHFLRPPSAAPGATFAEAVLENRNAGTRVGPYELIECLGSGGMGTIYRARRADDEYDTEVAVKLIKTGSLSRDSLRRFQHERQTLANLDHPNIARMIDGGTSEDGTPYLVMQYIDGILIDQYCDEHSLSIIERLELFRKVCAAVQQAHQNLIVHRDLKPKNILVTRQGEPVLLDFGISKCLEENEAGTRDRTMTAMRIMTPQYASPEQLRGEEVTTASDVYSLGVVLYELLTGHRPYRIRHDQAHAALRIIDETEPDTPSEAVDRTVEIDTGYGTTTTITPQLVSKLRGDRPDRLRRRLRGDLDTIVMTAIHKDPQRRYQSVEQISEDNRRYLEGRPILARPDTFGYRAGKFLRRNKAATFASGVANLALIAGTAGTSAGLVRATKALREAGIQREIARTEAVKAERINRFLLDMLSSADPFIESKDLTMREVLDKAGESLVSETDLEPEIRGALHETIGQGQRA